MQAADHLIFLSYASPDRERVEPYYRLLSAKGYSVWMDCKDLQPGQNWNFEIQRALEKATFVVAFISNNSIDRRGFVQRELKLALDKLNEKLPEDIYLIPVALDKDARVPDSLRAIQVVQSSASDCNERILASLDLQLNRLGVVRTQAREAHDLSWSSRVFRESWEGLPGYEVELQYFEFASEKYPSVRQITEAVWGRLLSALFEHRGAKLAQSPDYLNFGQDKYFRTNTYDAHCSQPAIIGRMLSMNYAVHGYGAGAAHGNLHFETYNFVLDPLFEVRALAEMFDRPDEAFARLQQHVRQKLFDVELGDGSEKHKLIPDQVNSGTRAWEDFRAFVFNPEGIEILFPPYQVAAYACGPQFAKVPYQDIAGHMRPEFVDVMGLQHFLIPRKPA